MDNLQGLFNHQSVRLAGTDFTVRILLNGQTYFTHPNGSVYRESLISEDQDTGIRFLSAWNNDKPLYHANGNPYSYIVLGNRIVDITSNFPAFGSLPAKNLNT